MPDSTTPTDSPAAADKPFAAAERFRKRATGISVADGSLTISPKMLTWTLGLLAIVAYFWVPVTALADGPRQLRDVAAIVHDLTPVVQQLRSDLLVVSRATDAANAATGRLEQRVGVLETQNAGFVVLKDQRDRQLQQLDNRVTVLEQRLHR